MFEKKQFIHLLVVSFVLIGSTLEYEDLIFELLIRGGDATPIMPVALKTFWLADCISRFIGGFIAYYTFGRLNIWTLIIAFATFNLIGHLLGFVIFFLGIELGSLILVPSVIVGLASGVWVSIPLEIIRSSGLKNLGKNWGTVLLFGMLGYLVFSNASIFTGNTGKITEVLLSIFALIGLGSAYLGWKHDAEEKSLNYQVSKDDEGLNIS